MQVASPKPTAEKGILAEQFVEPALPAPDKPSVADPEDKKPWDAKDDNVLRNLVVKYRVGSDEPPWQIIAMKANFGHNSGSCKKRWEELPPVPNENADVFVFKGKNGGGEVIATKRKGFGPV